MNGFKRRRPESLASEPTPVKTSPAPISELAEITIPAHVQRSLIAFTTKLQQAVQRIDQLEESLGDLNDQLMNTPSHSDVLEVRMHGAKLAAELARTTVELRGEIGMADAEARRAARVARTAADAEVAPPECEPLDMVTVEAEVQGAQKPHPFSQTA